MHHIDNAVVKGGKIVLSDLPFAEGQLVRIVVAEADAQSAKKASIHEIRCLLKGGVERLDDPFEPMIPADHWEMLK
jgi:hypothetical protein